MQHPYLMALAVAGVVGTALAVGSALSHPRQPASPAPVEAPKAGDVTAKSCDISGDRYLKSGDLKVSVTNRSHVTRSYSISWEILTSDGVRLGRSTFVIRDLAPGRTAVESDTALASEYGGTRCRIISVT